MRITNKMMMNNTLNNVNTNKTLLDKLSTQMSTGQKISRASEDPVVAIRALRLKSSISELSQYYNNNISDAESWMDSTETALENIYECVEDMYSDASKLATGTYDTSQKEDILNELISLKEQVYSEGNADYCGRSLLTGYKTNMDLAFKTDDTSAKYQITETFSGSDIQKYTYVSGCMDFDVSSISTTTDTEYTSTDIQSNSVYRMRLAYTDLSESLSSGEDMAISYSTSGKASTSISVPADSGTLNFKIGSDGTLSVASSVSTDTVTDNGDGTYTIKDSNGDEKYTVDASTSGSIVVKDSTGATINDTITYSVDNGTVTASASIPVNVTSISATVSTTATEASDAAYSPAAGTVNYIPETGEIIFGEGTYQALQGVSSDTIKFTYEKEGFSAGDLKPENYFDCTNLVNGYTYTNDNVSQDIEYRVNFNQTLTVNVEAKDVFDQSIARDLDDLIGALSDLIDIENTVSDIQSMIDSGDYSDQEDYLNSMLEAAEKQQTLLNDKLVSLAGSTMTSFQSNMDSISKSITDLGSRGDRLDLTKSRASEQLTNLQTLQSDNISVELSDVVIEQSAASLAYDAALTAASKVVSHSLLDFL